MWVGGIGEAGGGGGGPHATTVRLFSLALEHTWVTGFSLFEYFTCL